MSCCTCGHTMQAVRVGSGVWLCPRCGTAHDGGNVWVPALVDRCRSFENAVVGASVHTAAEWCRLGIPEAIRTPDARG